MSAECDACGINESDLPDMEGMADFYFERVESGTFCQGCIALGNDRSWLALSSEVGRE